MRISILTLFPDMFAGPFDYSIVKRAKDEGRVAVNIVNIRDFATDAYKSVDDHPYGGGTGMIMRVDVIDRALEAVSCQLSAVSSKKILLDPRGEPFTQKKAGEYSAMDHLILICGHYEGVDERVRMLVDESVSVGDYILTGGELPAMTITDAVVRLLPGVLKKEATTNESFRRQKLLEYPQYTRPDRYKGMRVPDVLLSGDHKKIMAWKAEMTTARTDRSSRLKKQG